MVFRITSFVCQTCRDNLFNLPNIVKKNNKSENVISTNTSETTDTFVVLNQRILELEQSPPLLPLWAPHRQPKGLSEAAQVGELLTKICGLPVAVTLAERIGEPNRNSCKVLRAVLVGNTDMTPKQHSILDSELECSKEMGVNVISLKNVNGVSTYATDNLSTKYAVDSAAVTVCYHQNVRGLTFFLRLNDVLI